MTLSIEVRNNSVLAVQANVSKNKIVTKRQIMFEIPDSLIDTKGVIDPTQFARLVEASLSDHRMKEKKFILCINNASVIYREITIPKIDEKKLLAVVRSEMISSLNLTNEYIIDYIILEEYLDDQKLMLRVLAIAILGTALRSYIEAFKEIKMKAEVMETATSSIIKLVEYSGVADNGEPMIIAEIENGYLKLFLFEDGKYVLTRNTKINDYSPEAKDQIIGLAEDNINKMMQFQFTRPSRKSVKKVLLIGDDELIGDVSKNVNENLQISTDIFPMPRFLTNSSDDKQYYRYLNAVSAMLRK